MIPTPIRLAGGPGFWRRSMEEFKRQANIAIRMEGLHKPQKPYPLVAFDKQDGIDRCKIMSDADMGGFSKAGLTFQPASHATQASEDDPPHALFRGRISTELPPNRPNIQRSGYAAWRTRDRGVSLFGKLLWDIDPYNFLALRVKSDGRQYMVNIQTESIVPTDLHQHRLTTVSPGEWETVIIPFNAFVRTNYGMVVEPQKEMMRQKVKSVGIGLIDRVQGPFELRIADVAATNRAPSREIGREESGFDLEPEATGMLDEVGPRRKKGEPEKILI
ncbi:hypothetical protein MBLNU230_g6738t1 [Neophaeotheca triangularis]